MSLGADDYRAGERTFQLLTQAAGRAGRGTLPGEVVIQSYQPQHYSIKWAAAQDYESFYQEEILYREMLSYPPAAHMLAVQIFAKEEEKGKDLAKSLADVVKSTEDVGQISPRLTVMGPSAAAIGKINDIFRFVFYIKHEKYDNLVVIKDLLEENLKVWAPRQESVQFDFDPINTL